MAVGSLYIGLMVHCVVPKGIHTSPTEGIFLRPPTPVEIFGPLRPPPPPTHPPTIKEFPIPSVGGSMDIFWSYTLWLGHRENHFSFFTQTTLLLLMQGYAQKGDIAGAL